MTTPELQAGITYADLGIEIPHGKASGDAKCHCPLCHPERKNQSDKSLSVNLDRGEWKCHHCQWQSGLGKEATARAQPAMPRGTLKARYGGEMAQTPSPPPNVAQRPQNQRTEASWDNPEPLPAQLEGWAELWLREERGLSPQTIEHFRIRSSYRAPGVEEQIWFPYFLNGRHVNSKRRMGEAPTYKEFRQSKNAIRSLFNIDACKGAGTIVVAEGELDVMACYEAGWKSVVSAPDGAPGRNRETGVVAEVGSKGRAFEEPTAEKLFAAAAKIVIATDADDEGQKLAEWLIAKYGIDKCWRVRWPEGCKDANDVLLQKGAKALDDLIAKARPVDLPGIYRFGDHREDLKRVRREGFDRGMTTGFPNLDLIYRPKIGQVIYFLGLPGTGKTSLITHHHVNLTRDHDMRIAVFSPEMGNKTAMSKKYAEVVMGKPLEQMTDEEIDIAMDWVDERFFAIDALHGDDAGFGTLTLDDVIERAEMTSIKLGANGLIIDPWNRMAAAKPGNMTPTEYANFAGNKLSRLAQRNKMVVWVNLHPSKMSRRGSDEEMPSPHDANESAHWYNMADVFLGIHRNKWTEPINQTTVKVWKHREEGISGELGEAYFSYDRESGRFSPWDTSEVRAPVRHQAYPDLPEHLRDVAPPIDIEPTISWDAEDL